MGESIRLHLGGNDYDHELAEDQLRMIRMKEMGRSMSPEETIGYPTDGGPRDIERYYLRWHHPETVAETMQKKFPEYVPFSGFGSLEGFSEYLSGLAFLKPEEVREYVKWVSKSGFLS
jgi:hypothetical protein